MVDAGAHEKGAAKSVQVAGSEAKKKPTGEKTTGGSGCEYPEEDVRVPKKATTDELLAGYNCFSPDEKREAALKKENPVRSLKLLKASPNDYSGKTTEFVGYFEIDDVFRYDYKDKSKYYSLKFKMYGDDDKYEDVHMYAPRASFGDLFKLLDKFEGEKRRILFKVAAMMKKPEHEDLWEISAAEPHIGWWRGECCEPFPPKETQ